MRAAALCAPLLVASLAFAEGRALTRARAQIEQLSYDEAQRSLAEAMREPGNPRDDVLAIYELQGIVAGYLKRTDEARDAFIRLLSLEPGRALPPRLPPRVATAFFEAKSQVAERGPVQLLRLPAQQDRGRITFLEVEVRGDVLNLGRAVRFFTTVDGVERSVDARLQQGRASAAVDGVHVAWSAQLLGARDAVLLELPAAVDTVDTVDGSSEGLGATARAPPVAPRRTFARIVPAAGAVLSAASLATAIGLGVTSRQAYGAYDGAMADGAGIVPLTRVEADGLLGRARSTAVAANAMFSVAAVLAVAALVGLIAWLGAAE